MPNLVLLISQFLTPDMVTRIASAFGFDRGMRIMALLAHK